MSCWRYTPTPKQDRFQDLLEAIRPEFLHTNLSKYNKYYIYSNIPQLLSAEVVLCTHKTTILCHFGLFRHKLTTISPSILNHSWWELYHRRTVELRFSWECVLSHTWMSPWTQKGISLCGLDPRKRSVTYVVMDDETSV